MNNKDALFKKLKKKKRCVINEGNIFYKLMLYENIENAINEDYAYKLVKSNKYWCNFNNQFFDFEYQDEYVAIGWSSASLGVTLDNPSVQEAVIIKLRHALVEEDFEQNNWKYHLQSIYSNNLLYDYPELENFICKIMEGVELPKTGCHGDLSPGNILYDQGSINIIDWELYNENGSIIIDLCWLIGCILRKKVSPDCDVVNIASSNSIILYLSGLTPLQTTILYSANKLSVDLQLHHIDFEKSFDDFLIRVTSIKNYCHEHNFL